MIIYLKYIMCVYYDPGYVIHVLITAVCVF